MDSPTPPTSAGHTPAGTSHIGLGSGLASGNAVLVGTRDIDGPEQALIDDGTVALVQVGPRLAEELRAVVAGRPVYVHIDCDVLDAGTVPTDYLVPDGLSLADLHAAAAVLAESEVVGIEVGELESAPDEQDPPSYVSALIAALEPLWTRLEETRPEATDDDTPKGDDSRPEAARA